MVQESKIRRSVVSFSHAPQISKFKFSLLAKTHLVRFILDHEGCVRNFERDLFSCIFASHCHLKHCRTAIARFGMGCDINVIKETDNNLLSELIFCP